MAQANIICGRCGRAILAGEMSQGRAIVTENASVCQECASRLAPEERQALLRVPTGGSGVPAGRAAAPVDGREPQPRGSAAGQIAARAEPGSGPGGRAGSRRLSRGSHRIETAGEPPEADAKPRSGKGLVVAILAGAALVGAGAALLVGSRSPEKPGPEGTGAAAARAGRDKPAKSPSKARALKAAATPARRRFAEIKQVFDPSYTNYDEGRKLLREFLGRYPDAPEAEEAKRLLAKMHAEEVKAAAEAFARAEKRAERLASQGRFDEAMKVLRESGGRLAESAWSKTGGEGRIAAACGKVEAARLTAAKAALERARESLRSKRLDEARRALASRAGWPREVQDAAEAILREVAAIEAEAEKLRRREEMWRRFVCALYAAGKKGTGEAAELAARERGALREAGFGGKLARLEGLIREAGLVEELAEIGLAASRRTIRLRVGDRRVAGKVVGVKDGVVRLKPLHGEAIDVPVPELGVASIMAASGVGRSEGGDPLKAAAYLAVRGELAAARKKIAGIASKKSRALAADIGELDRIIVPPKITSAAPAEARKDSFYSHAFTASGATPIRFSLYRPADLPAGLTWNAAAATISGTPTAVGGSPGITLTAASGVPPDAKLAFTITVSDAVPAPEGKILREWWLPGVGAGGAVLSTKKPGKATGSELVASFDGPRDWEDNYNSRLRGYIHPPADGRYVFRLCGDDQCELWLSTDEDPANMVRIAQSDGWKEPTDWSVESGAISLRAGRRYYVEAVHREYVGLDHIRVGWDRPDGASEKPIPGKYLSPWREAGARGASPVVASRPEEPGPAPKPAPEPAPEPTASVPVEGPPPGETGLPGKWAPGLICEIFKGRDLRNRIGVRIDRGIDYDFVRAAPDLAGKARPFSMRWRGYFLAPVEGRYNFLPQGGMRVKLNGKKVGGEGGVMLTRGLHAFEAATAEKEGGSWKSSNTGSLKWGLNGQNSHPQPGSAFYHKVGEAGPIGPFAKLVRGLNAEYFKDLDCRQRVAKGTIENVDFDLHNEPACTRCGRDRFSVRITGYLLVPRKGEYTFVAETHGDDGVELQIADKKVIDRWARGVKQLPQKASLEPGYHKLAIRFRDFGGGAKLRLRMKPGDGWGNIVPACSLFREAPVPRPVARPGLAPGIKGYMYPGLRPAGRPAVERLDTYLSFDWSGRRPHLKLRKDLYCAAWQGMVMAPEPGKYVFWVYHEGGGVELSVAGKRVVNRLTTGKGNEISNPIKLPAGPVGVTLIYSHKKEAKSILKLFWIGPSFTKTPVGGGDLVRKGKFVMAEPPKEPPRPKPKPEPPTEREPEKPAEPLPKGNLVPNGGFEKIDAATRFAERWRKHQWGGGKGAFSVRLDRVNSHTGDRSLVARTLADDVHPGARTTLTSALVPGTYEVRFWGCAAIGKSADVCAHLAGRAVMSATVGEDWKQFKKRIEIKEKKVRPSLRLYTTTSGVRVWFDDVEVEAVAAP